MTTKKTIPTDNAVAKPIRTRKAPAKKSPKTAVLNGVSDIRRFFHKNEPPLYFTSAPILICLVQMNG